VLDFYHGIEHVWGLGRRQKEKRSQSLGGAAAASITAWEREKGPERKLPAVAGPKGSGAKYGPGAKLFCWPRTPDEISAVATGGPIGSGAVESACRQRQCRFKRPGNFGLQKACGIFAPWKKPGIITLGRTLGREQSVTVRMRPPETGQKRVTGRICPT